MCPVQIGYKNINGQQQVQSFIWKRYLLNLFWGRRQHFQISRGFFLFRTTLTFVEFLKS